MHLGALSDAELHLFERIVVLGRGTLLWSGPPYEAVGWFERRLGGSVPLARTAVDFLHEASSTAPDEGARAFADSPDFERHVAEPLRRAASTAPPARPPTYIAERLGVLTGQYWRRVRRRRGYLLGRLLQAVVLGLVVGWLFRRGALHPLVPFSPGDTSTVLMWILPLWLGAGGAVWEIVRDRPVLLRERGFAPSAARYLGARLLIQASITLAQVAIMSLSAWLLMGVERHASLPPVDTLAWIELWAWLWAWCGLTAVCQGLLLSAIWAGWRSSARKSRYLWSSLAGVLLTLAVLLAGPPPAWHGSSGSWPGPVPLAAFHCVTGVTAFFLAVRVLRRGLF